MPLRSIHRTRKRFSSVLTWGFIALTTPGKHGLSSTRDSQMCWSRIWLYISHHGCCEPVHRPAASGKYGSMTLHRRMSKFISATVLSILAALLHLRLRYSILFVLERRLFGGSV